MARYRKLDPRLWGDEKFQGLDPVEKLVALYSMTAQSNRIGLFRFSPAKAAEDLGIADETFRPAFGKVCERFRWSFDKGLRVLFIPTWWKYNRPENPNVLKSCLEDLHELPATPLIALFMSNVRHLPQTFHQTLLEGYPQPSPKRMPHQEQEQEQEQEQDRKQRSVSSERSSADAPDPSEPAPGPPCDEKRHRQSGKKPTTHGIGSIVASVPLADGSDAPVTDDIVAEWTKAFPGVNVLEQLGRIRVYFLTNPQKRKTAAGIGRCITGWLSREQDRGGPRRETFRSRAPDFQPPVIPGKYAGLETVIKVEPVQPSDRKENIQ